MTVIGHFVPDIDGYVGSIRTLTLHARLRIVAIDNKPSEEAPDFKVLFGMQEVGAAWKAKTHEAEPRDYLSAVIDDPSFPEPVRCAMFEENGKLTLVWRRKGYSGLARKPGTITLKILRPTIWNCNEVQGHRNGKLSIPEQGKRWDIFGVSPRNHMRRIFVPLAT